MFVFISECIQLDAVIGVTILSWNVDPVLINIAKRLFERRIEGPEMKFSRSVATCTLYDLNVHE